MITADYKPKIGKKKHEQLIRLQEQLTKYSTVAVINLENLPAAQFQKIRAKIRSKLLFQIVKKTVILRALEAAQAPGVKTLLPLVTGVPALLLTNESAPTLNTLLLNQQTSAAAKPGQIAPYDLSLPAGPTPFTPGPVIGELGQLGIKTEVKEGKIHIREEKVVVKQGQPIPGKIADLLAKMGVEPVKISIALEGAVDRGTFFSKEVLSITPEQYQEQLTSAIQHAFNLAVFMSYPASPEVTELLIQKAQREANALAASTGVSSEPAAEASPPTPPPAPEPPKEQTPPTTPIPSPPVQHTAPQPTLKQESPTSIQSDEAAAQAVLKKLQDQKMKEAEQKNPQKPPQQYHQLGQPKDINTLINKLKDTHRG